MSELVKDEEMEVITETFQSGLRSLSVAEAKHRKEVGRLYFRAPRGTLQQL